MSKLQLLAATIHLDADRDNTCVRDKFDPITFPEMLVLRALHGGEEHVHSVAVVGYSDRPAAVERERLELKYGKGLVGALFPGVTQALPLEDPTLPSAEEIEAGTKAAKEARAKVRKTKSAAPAPVADAPTVPDLTT